MQIKIVIEDGEESTILARTEFVGYSAGNRGVWQTDTSEGVEAVRSLTADQRFALSQLVSTMAMESLPVDASDLPLLAAVHAYRREVVRAERDRAAEEQSARFQREMQRLGVDVYKTQIITGIQGDVMGKPGLTAIQKIIEAEDKAKAAKDET